MQRNLGTNLFIKPEFPGTDLDEKRFDFSTSSPQPSDISAVLTSVSASNALRPAGTGLRPA